MCTAIILWWKMCLVCMKIQIQSRLFMPCGMTYKLHDWLTDSITNYYLCILFVMWYYAIPKHSSLNVTCRSWLHACTRAEPVSHNTYNCYTIKIFVWCYVACITCFYRNILLTWVILLQALLNNSLYAMGNVKYCMMELQTILHKHCLVQTKTATL